MLQASYVPCFLLMVSHIKATLPEQNGKKESWCIKVTKEAADRQQSTGLHMECLTAETIGSTQTHTCSPQNNNEECILPLGRTEFYHQRTQVRRVFNYWGVKKKMSGLPAVLYVLQNKQHLTIPVVGRMSFIRNSTCHSFTNSMARETEGTYLRTFR